MGSVRLSVSTIGISAGMKIRLASRCSARPDRGSRRCHHLLDRDVAHAKMMAEAADRLVAGPARQLI
jgi:hypothetical protein